MGEQGSGRAGCSKVSHSHAATIQVTLNLHLVQIDELVSCHVMSYRMVPIIRIFIRYTKYVRGNLI